MSYKKIIPYINAEGEIDRDIIKLAKEYSDKGADELLLYNFSKEEGSRGEFFKLAKQVARLIDIPFIIGCSVNNFEDAKIALYTGASGILLSNELLDKPELIKDISSRFGENKLYLEMDKSLFMESNNVYDQSKSLGIASLLIDYGDYNEAFNEKITKSNASVIIRDNLKKIDIKHLLEIDNVTAITTDYYIDKDIMKAKQSLKIEKIQVNVLESKIPFTEFKLNNEGLIPVITQDYKTGQVLMLAYMNEEAYNRTIIDGKMTYFSRSRNSLWLKGETSGNIQYLKEILLDCDKDTLLAKVASNGPACHTGNESCFYSSLLAKEYKSHNSYDIFENVYDLIMDRKKNPKEGSYTNYLFDKGLDKILKKCGEEATEIIIAAKNPEIGELRYEIADFLYHLMVLMAENELDWEDITRELADRR